MSEAQSELTREIRNFTEAISNRRRSYEQTSGAVPFYTLIAISRNDQIDIVTENNQNYKTLSKTIRALLVAEKAKEVVIELYPDKDSKNILFSRSLNNPVHALKPLSGLGEVQELVQAELNRLELTQLREENRDLKEHNRQLEQKSQLGSIIEKTVPLVENLGPVLMNLYSKHATKALSGTNQGVSPPHPQLGYAIQWGKIPVERQEVITSFVNTLAMAQQQEVQKINTLFYYITRREHPGMLDHLLTYITEHTPVNQDLEITT